MARSYCNVADVTELLPQNIIVEGQNPMPDPFNPSPETLPTVNVNDFIQMACGIIDSAIGTIYDTPLVKVNQGGDVDYPNPVPVICKYLAAEMIYEQRLQGADKQRAESQKAMEGWAHDELARIQNGERALIGQRNTRGNRYVRNNAVSIPRNPAFEGKSDKSNRS